MESYSNYYMKISILVERSDGIDSQILMKVPVDDSNVFTVCPLCGDEFAVNLEEVGADFDFTGTATYCPECAEFQKKRMGNL